MDTIYALATPYGKSGVAVVRISGENASKVFELFSISKEIKPRQTHLCKLLDENKQPLDEALIIFFPAPHSFTGENVVELHLHGSRAVIESVLDMLGKVKNMRLSQPGEFSKRAFLNQKLDLTRAEGLADLIDAETRQQQKQAMQQFGGSLQKLYDAWREDIIEIMAYVEAFIDFPDEDIPSDIASQIETRISNLIKQIELHSNDKKVGEALRDGYRVVIAGPPNAGKSSLLNYLAERDIAIVSDIAGTTRDFLEVHLDIEGYHVILTDTAGIRQTDDVIELAGVERAQAKVRDADLSILLFSGEDIDTMHEYKKYSDSKSIIVLNKIDLFTLKDLKDIDLEISIKQNQGLDELLARITKHVREYFSVGSGPIITRKRYRQHLLRASEFLSEFSLAKPIELCAEDLRLAVQEIGQITGHVGVEDILDKLFSNFCIGK